MMRYNKITRNGQNTNRVINLRENQWTIQIKDRPQKSLRLHTDTMIQLSVTLDLSIYQYLFCLIVKLYCSPRMFGPNFEDQAINFRIESFIYSNNNSIQIQDGLDPHIIASLQRSQKQFSLFFHPNRPNISTVIPPQVVRLIAKNHPKMVIDQNLTSDNLQKLIQNRINKMVRNKRVKYKWGLEDIKILAWIVSNYCNVYDINYTQFAQQDWEKISTMIPGAQPESAKFKWLSLVKDEKSQEWSRSEDIILKDLILKQNISSDQYDWPQIAKLLYKYNDSSQKIFRGPKKCRERWNCFINPNIKKGRWDKKEDVKLMKMVNESQNSKRWAIFSMKFEGRTQNAIKNRFNYLISKEKKYLQESSNQKILNEAQIITSFLAKHKNHPGLDDPPIQNKCLESPFNQVRMFIREEGSEKELQKKGKYKDQDQLKPANCDSIQILEKKYQSENIFQKEEFQMVKHSQKYNQSQTRLINQQVEPRTTEKLSQLIQKESSKIYDIDFNSVDDFLVSNPNTIVRTHNDLQKRSQNGLEDQQNHFYSKIYEDEERQLKKPKAKTVEKLI